MKSRHKAAKLSRVRHHNSVQKRLSKTEKSARLKINRLRREERTRARASELLQAPQPEQSTESKPGLKKEKE